MRFAHQAEYRLLWFTDGVVQTCLSVKAPIARTLAVRVLRASARGLEKRSEALQQALVTLERDRREKAP